MSATTDNRRLNLFQKVHPAHLRRCQSSVRKPRQRVAPRCRQQQSRPPLQPVATSRWLPPAAVATAGQLNERGQPIGRR